MSENLEQIKASLDIVTIAELYGELEKSGANYRYKNDHSIVINPSKQIFSNFNGDITGGSVLDLIAYMEKLELKEAIKRLKELAGADTYKIDPALQLKRKEEATKKKVVDFRSLGLFAKNDLTAVSPYKPYIMDINGNQYLQVKEPYIKLFETDKLDISYKERVDTAFSKFIGYDAYFTCPSIIIRDKTNRVVDKCAYRPNKPEKWDTWRSPKYIYKNQVDRGSNFLYPLQLEMEELLHVKKVFVVGEGIKNAVNAYIHGMPFISLESASTNTSKELSEYILALLNRGYKIIAFFDGDGDNQDPKKWTKGKLAFEKFKKTTSLYDLENAVSFDSDIDFTDYIVGGAK